MGRNRDHWVGLENMLTLSIYKTESLSEFSEHNTSLRVASVCRMHFACFTSMWICCNLYAALVISVQIMLAISVEMLLECVMLRGLF
jgi:diacylglycerol kinase